MRAFCPDQATTDEVAGYTSANGTLTLFFLEGDTTAVHSLKKR